MKNGKRIISALVALVMVMMLFAGCGRIEKKEDSVFSGDSDALQIFVRAHTNYAQSLVEKFPDIKFDFYYYGGLNGSMTMQQLLENDDFGDVCISSLQATDDVAKEHLMDLSGMSFCGRYEPSILTQFDVDGCIYQIPGYVSMRNIVYNKTMFEEHGWKEPKSFGEMVDLCRQIREEAPEITPIVMGGAASGYYFTTMTSFAQAEYLYTPDGKQWMQEYQKGKARAKDGFGEGIAMTQELIDAGAFDYDKNIGLWDGGIFTDRMMTGEAAMMFAWGEHTRIAKYIMDSEETEFRVMPFRNRSGNAFIGTNMPYYIGISKKLEEKKNEKKLENAMRVLDYLATEEGMRTLAADNLSAISPLKKAENTEVFDIYLDFWNDNLDSIKAPMLYTGFEDIIDPAAEIIMDAVEGKGDLSGLSGCIDEVHQKYVNGGKDAIEVGRVAKDFSHEETVQLFADMLYEACGSDMAMVSDGAYKEGVVNEGGSWMRLFEGPLIEDCLTCTIPGMNLYEKTVQLTLTGSRLKELLEKGKRVDFAEYTGWIWTEKYEKEAYFDYYFAGADVKWKSGKIASVTLADGRRVEDGESYTIVFAPWDYTSELYEEGDPVELDDTVADIFREYIKTHSPLQPPKLSR